MDRCRAESGRRQPVTGSTTKTACFPTKDAVFVSGAVAKARGKRVNIDRARRENRRFARAQARERRWSDSLSLEIIGLLMGSPLPSNWLTTRPGGQRWAEDAETAGVPATGLGRRAELCLWRFAVIDVSSEALVALSVVPRYLPRRRGGKKPHVSCIYRWTTSGCRGVVLESVQVGGTRCTSREALARFFERLTYGEAANLPRPRSIAERERATSRAMAELEAAKI